MTHNSLAYLVAIILGGLALGLAMAFDFVFYLLLAIILVRRAVILRPLWIAVYRGEQLA